MQDPPGRAGTRPAARVEVRPTARVEARFAACVDERGAARRDVRSARRGCTVLPSVSRTATDNPRRAYALIVIASAFFAAMFAGVKLLPARVSSSEVLFVRGLIGVGGAGLALAWTRQPFRIGAVGVNLVRAACGTASVLCQYFAVHEAGAEIATANLLTQSAPLWILVLSAPLLGETAPPRTKWALAAGLVGTALALGPSRAGERLGLVLALLSGAFSALALLSVRKLVSTENAASVVLFFMAFAAVCSAPLALHGVAEHGLWTPSEFGVLAAVGACGTVGQLVMTQAYRYASAASVSIAGLAQVAFSALFSFALLGSERPSVGAIVGGILVLGAGLLAIAPWRARATPVA